MGAFRALRGVVAATCLAFALPAVAASGALATPGWECVPTTAGQAVVSGGRRSAVMQLADSSARADICLQRR